MFLYLVILIHIKVEKAIKMTTSGLKLRDINIVKTIYCVLFIYMSKTKVDIVSTKERKLQ